MFLLHFLLLFVLQEPKRLYWLSKERRARPSHWFLRKLQVLRPVKVGILQVRCLHTYFESSLFHSATAWVEAQEVGREGLNKMTAKQKKSWQAQEEPSPGRPGNKQSQEECKVLLLTIQSYTGNIFIFKNYIIEDPQ